MSNLRIDTDSVLSAANNISNLNNQIKDAFGSVQTAISKLDESWDGAAATTTISKFNEIKSKFFDARYNVLDNYVNFLLQQVGEGYKQVENANISLADQFK